MTNDKKKSKKQKLREYKELAQHITYTDTLNHQHLLRKRIEDLRRNNEFLRPSERTKYLDEVSKATFGEALLLKVYMDIPGGKIQLYENLHTFAENMGYIHGKTVIIKSGGKEYKGQIWILWDVLLKHLLIVFPYAQREAHRRSAERERYEGGGVFSYEPSKRYG